MKLLLLLLSFQILNLCQSKVVHYHYYGLTEENLAKKSNNSRCKRTEVAYNLTSYHYCVEWYSEAETKAIEEKEAIEKKKSDAAAAKKKREQFKKAYNDLNSGFSLNLATLAAVCGHCHPLETDQKFDCFKKCETLINS